MKLTKAILCVDDESVILDSLKHEFKQYFGKKYIIELAQSAEEALEILEEFKEDNIELIAVISDYLMPSMKGDEFLIAVHSKMPNVKKLMLTGQANIEGITNVINDANLYRYINKPWESDDLILTLNEAVKSYEQEQDLQCHVQELKKLNIEIINTQKEVVYRMGAIGETRSKETGMHVKRVAEYSKLLALLIGLSDEDAELIKMASPMHDIGKVGILDSILNKCGKLTEDEFKVMKTHAQIGADMLSDSKREILQAAHIIALEHHEKWDGSGYPNGKVAKNIHIFGRITAFADVFDALGSDRCYKKQWELQRIFDLIKSERAKHFDPFLVDKFFENLDKFLIIRDTFQD